MATPGLGKTRKIRTKPAVQENMWGLFESECKPNTPIECVYRTSGEREVCDLCRHSLQVTDEGFLACSNSACGSIYTDILDRTAEWRYYGGDDNQGSDPTRCGMPLNPLLQESSYGCKVICPAKCTYEMRKIRRYTEWQSMPYKEKAQYDEFQRIINMGHNSGVCRLILDDAVRYHKKVSEHKTFRGSNRDGIISASIYIASRINNHPRTAKEIAAIFNLDNTSATKGCKNAMTILNEIEKEMSDNEKTYFKNTTPSDFIDRYCSKLNINNELTKVCKFAAMQIENKKLVPENTPQSVAAGIVYFISISCHLNLSKKQIWQQTGTSEVTIGKCYAKLEKVSHLIIPPVILQKYARKSSE